MSERFSRVRVEGVDWPAALPVVHLFQSFRMAIQPAKLLLGLLLVVLVYLGGRGLDFAFGPQVQPGDFAGYVSESWPSLGPWARHLPGSEGPSGIFETALTLETAAIESLVQSVLGVAPNEATAALPGSGLEAGAWAGAAMLAAVPGWLATHHPGFLALLALGKLLVVGLIGGAICRLAALEACRSLRGSLGQGLRFAGGKYVWLVLAPVLPLLVAGLIGLLLAGLGALLMNFPVADVVGAVLTGPLMFGGLVIALILIGLALGAHLLYPAVAVEGTDAFDAVSRAYNYVLGRPWRYLAYALVALVYGAVTYLFVAVVVFLTLYLTRLALGLWVVADLAGGEGRLEAILPVPQFGELIQPIDWAALSGHPSASIAAWIAGVWVRLVVALLPAFAVGYYFSAHTWIYLLLRRAADGTEFDDMYLEADEASEQTTETDLSPEAAEPAEERGDDI